MDAFNAPQIFSIQELGPSSELEPSAS